MNSSPDDRDEAGVRGQGYLPALRFPALTRVYDPVVAATTREQAFKERLLELAARTEATRILDLGSGTGTLAIRAKQRFPHSEVVGLDGDPAVLDRAQEKATGAGVEAHFDQGLSTELPNEPGSFDLILSTLFFHHLDSDAKQATLAEVKRVLRPGGRLVIADWAEARDPLMWMLSWPLRLFDGVKRTRENFTGALPGLLAQAGFEDVR